MDDTLFVVSTDLCHWGLKYIYIYIIIDMDTHTKTHKIKRSTNK